MNEKKIREDIQFLRGLSVLLIFFFHFDQQLFKYLYVGVDIFFLISGYVITSSIFKSIKYNNNFDLFGYFLKRIKRIYPALIFFLVCFNFLFFSIINFTDGEYIEKWFSTLTSIFGISNFYYLLNPKLGYFDPNIKWLQHTWSLSNEIQFYVLYGLLIFFLIKLKNLINLNKSTIYLLIIISFFSLFCFFFGTNKLYSDYYSSFARFWEFFLGALAYLINSKNIKSNKINFNYVVIIFLTSLFFLNFFVKDLDHKIIISLSLILIAPSIFFKDQNYSVKTNSIFKFFGNISYSFFLWHLPIISFLKGISDIVYFNFIFSLLVTTIVAFTSYKLIEIPFNQKSILDKIYKNIIKIFSISSIFILFIFILNLNLVYDLRNFAYKKIIKFYPIVSKFNRNEVDDNKTDNWVLRFDKCENNYENFSWLTRLNCISDKDDENLFFILGNSYADHIVPTVYSLKKNISLYKSRFENCHINIDTKCNGKLEIIINNYNKISKKFENKYLILSLNTNNGSENYKQVSYEKLQRILEKLSTNTKVIFIYPHPPTETLANKLEYKRHNLTKKEDFKNFSKLSSNYDLYIFDTYSYLCQKKECKYNDYVKYFADDAHFKVSTSYLLAENLKKFLKSFN